MVWHGTRPGGRDATQSITFFRLNACARFLRKAARVVRAKPLWAPLPVAWWLRRAWRLWFSLWPGGAAKLGGAHCRYLRHDPRIPRLVGFARCTGDGVFEATVWDVAVHPLYQGSGLGSQLMVYVLEALEAMGTERVSLFADPGVVNFYQRQGWELEPQQHRCAFWYAS